MNEFGDVGTFKPPEYNEEREIVDLNNLGKMDKRKSAAEITKETLAEELREMKE